MPWSNQSGGGGGRRGGGGGPWGQGPSGGGPHHQPDLEEILKRSQDKIKQVIPGGGSGLPGSLVFVIAVVVAAGLAFYALDYWVNADELGMVVFFGYPTYAAQTRL